MNASKNTVRYVLSCLLEMVKPKNVVYAALHLTFFAGTVMKCRGNVRALSLQSFTASQLQDISCVCFSVDTDNGRIACGTKGGLDPCYTKHKGMNFNQNFITS